MASFYGNIMTKNTMSNFSFDKIYSNRVAMQAAIGIDKEGNQTAGIDDGIFPGRYVLVEYGPQSDANAWRVGYEVNGYFCAEKGDESTRFTYEGTEVVFDVPHPIALNEYIRVKTGNGPYLYYRCKGQTVDGFADFESVGDYNDNYTIDYNAYGQNYDSTVWVKQLSTTGKPSYHNVASLNTVVPSFDLTIHAPTTPMQKPHWSDTNSSNVYYNLHLQNQWGLDVENKNNNFQWNEDGFDETKDNSIDSPVDSINFTQTISDNKYYNDATGEYEPVNDTQVLNITLQSVGNIGAKALNKIYEVDTKTKNRKRDIDWQYKLQNPTTGEITNEEHVPSLNGKSTNTSTIAGNINKFHDLIGEIIIKDETDSIPAILASEDYIYKKSDGYYYVQHNNTYGDMNKNVVIDLGYDYSVAKTDYQMANTQKVLYETPFITKYGKNLVYDSTGIISAKFAEEHQNDLVDIAEGGEPGAQTKVKFAYEEYLLWAKPWVEKKKKVYFVAIKGAGLLDEEAVGSLYLNADSADQTKLEIPAGTILANDTPIWLKIDPEGSSFNEMILKYRRLYSNNPDDFTNSFEGKSFMEFVREIQSEMGDATSYLDAQLQAFDKGINTRGKRADQALTNYEADLQDRLSSEDYEPGSADVALTNYKNELQNKTNEATTTLTDFTTAANNSTTTIQNEVNKVTTKANSLLTQQDITSIAVGTTTGYIQISGNETQLGNVEYIDLLKVSSSSARPISAEGNFTFYITEIINAQTSPTYYATISNGQIIDCNCEGKFIYYWDNDSYDFNVQINRNNISSICNKFFIKVINNSSIDILTVEIPTTIQDSYVSAIRPSERLDLKLPKENNGIYEGSITLNGVPTLDYIDLFTVESTNTAHFGITQFAFDFYITSNGDTRIPVIGTLNGLNGLMGLRNPSSDSKVYKFRKENADGDIAKIVVQMAKSFFRNPMTKLNIRVEVLANKDITTVTIPSSIQDSYETGDFGRGLIPCIQEQFIQQSNLQNYLDTHIVTLEGITTDGTTSVELKGNKNAITDAIAKKFLNSDNRLTVPRGMICDAEITVFCAQADTTYTIGSYTTAFHLKTSGITNNAVTAFANRENNESINFTTNGMTDITATTLSVNLKASTTYNQIMVTGLADTTMKWKAFVKISNIFTPEFE